MQSSSQSNYFIRIDALVGLFAEYLFDNLLDFRDSCRAADEQNLGDVVGCQFRIFERFVARAFEPFQNGFCERFKFAAADGNLEMFRPFGIGGDERQVDGSFKLGA